jgi:hypothetical protein
MTFNPICCPHDKCTKCEHRLRAIDLLLTPYKLSKICRACDGFDIYYNTTHRVCSRCNKDKPISEFNLLVSRPDYSKVCKECRVDNIKYRTTTNHRDYLIDLVIRNK